MAGAEAKLSKAIRCELAAVEGRSVIVAAVRTLTNDEVPSFTDLGLSLGGGKITAGDQAPIDKFGGKRNGRFGAQDYFSGFHSLT